MAGALIAPLGKLIKASAERVAELNDRIKNPTIHSLLLGSEKQLFAAVREHSANMEASLEAVASKYGVPARLIQAGFEDFLASESVVIPDATAAPTPVTAVPATPLEIVADPKPPASVVSPAPSEAAEQNTIPALGSIGTIIAPSA